MTKKFYQPRYSTSGTLNPINDKPPAASAGYRLLTDGEEVKATDEYLTVDCMDWLVAGNLIAGRIHLTHRDTPCRRRV